MGTPLDPNSFRNNELPNKSINYTYYNYSGVSLSEIGYFCFGGVGLFLIASISMFISELETGVGVIQSLGLVLPIWFMVFMMIVVGVGLFIAEKNKKGRINRLKEIGICVNAQIINIEPPEKRHVARSSFVPMYILVCSYVNQYGHRIDYRVPTKNVNPQKFLGRVVAVYINPQNFLDYMVDLDNFVM